MDRAAQDEGLVEALLEQLDALERRHGLAPGKETWAACAQMGMVPYEGDDGALAYLDEAGWYRLVCGIAKRDPGLAGMVAGACRGGVSGVGKEVHFAYVARGDGERWIVESPFVPAGKERYVLVAGENLRVLRSLSANPRRRSGDRVLTWQREGQEEDLPPVSAGANDVARGATRDLLAIRAGALSHAWRAALSHALERPMFHRKLSDFAHIRFRLLQAYAVLSAVHAISASLCGASTMALDDESAWSTLDALAATLRDELQQIGGGTGYMAETILGASIQWLDWCDSALAERAPRGLPGGLDPAVLFSVRRYLHDASSNESLLPPQACDQFLAVLTS